MVQLAQPIFGQSVKGSVFGNAPGFVDPTDSGLQASGVPVAGHPGIALGIPKSDPAFGQWYDVTFPSGQTYRLQQTDVGPAAWTGKTVDINAEAARQAGYTQENFPTGPGFTVTPVADGSGSVTMSPDQPSDPFSGPGSIPLGTLTDPNTGLPLGSDPNQCSVFGSLFGTCTPTYGGPTGLPGAKGTGAAAGAAAGSVLPALGASIADLFTRAGLVLLALVLIAAAAWALAHGELGQRRVAA